MIAEIKPNRGLEVYGVFHVHQEDREIEYHPFDENMTRDIQEGNAVAATDVSVKDGRMGGRWIISNRRRSGEISGELYHKEWNEITAGIAETITLLELITVLN